MYFAIRNHNKKGIEPTDNKRALIFARLLRDADKLDIYRVLSPFIESSDGSGLNSQFVKQFVNGEQVDYTQIRTMDDRKLVRLMWVYDVNFSWTLRHMVARGYIKRLIECLPESEDITRGVERLRAYVAEKCRETDRAF